MKNSDLNKKWPSRAIQLPKSFETDYVRGSTEGWNACHDAFMKVINQDKMNKAYQLGKETAIAVSGQENTGNPGKSWQEKELKPYPEMPSEKWDKNGHEKCDLTDNDFCDDCKTYHKGKCIYDTDGTLLDKTSCRCQKCKEYIHQCNCKHPPSISKEKEIYELAKILGHGEIGRTIAETVIELGYRKVGDKEQEFEHDWFPVRKGYETIRYDCTKCDISKPSPSTCEHCKGTGITENSKDQEIECIICDGKGFVQQTINQQTRKVSKNESTI